MSRYEVVSHHGVHEVVNCIFSNHYGVYEVYIVVIVECHGMSLLVIMECMRLLTIVILESIRLLTIVVIMKCMRLLIHYQKLVAALLECFIDISYCIPL